MNARMLRFPLLAIALIYLTGCSTTGSKFFSSNTAKCALAGGAVWGIPGAAHSLATGGASLAAGALVSGLACAYYGDSSTTTNANTDNTYDQPVRASDNMLEIRFGFDRFGLDETDKDRLDDFLSNLSEHDKLSYKVTGHTCNIGKKSYNQDLSERRANAIKAYLTEKGIASSHILTEGKGEANPHYDNDSEESRRANRRAEITIMAE
ncbi:Outer membrane porin F [invertebrate metagenome]|uniref:Outer membrane porin F n=1 Tax=invertebrate metagenome TaxID=1711999 RepID=A0A2H9TB12_9ZZZZ